MNYVPEILSALRKEIAHLPNSFYGSFEYTTTGQNLTHPVTLGILSKIIGQLDGITFVAVDLRLNEYSKSKSSKVKFQPDLVAISKVSPFNPVLFVDYESPNSCDTRIPSKDVDSYIEWSNAYGERVPYIVITTLPRQPLGDWELRYASKGNPNSKCKAKMTDLMRNPFVFWYSEYKKALQGYDLSGIHFLNIDVKKVELINLGKI